ncbi:MAG: hypothetical protein R3C44_24385 [Chloroflexota bacterium]
MPGRLPADPGSGELGELKGEYVADVKFCEPLTVTEVYWDEDTGVIG